MSDLGTTIRVIRQAKRMTQSALANSAGVSVALVSLAESGGRQPSAAVLQRIASALDIPADVLIAATLGEGTTLVSADQAVQSLVATVGRLAHLENELREHLSQDRISRATTRVVPTKPRKGSRGES